VIIGGGVTGASLAFQLARRGVRRVLVLERHFVGAGATGRSSALVRMHYANVPEAVLAIASFPWFQHWSDLVGGSCGFTPTGFVRIVSPDKLDRLRANVAMLQRLGADTRLVDRAELQELDPAASFDDVSLAAFEPHSGYADPAGTALGFMTAAREHGTELRQGVEVIRITVRGNRVTGVETTHGQVSAPVVVNAAGAWGKPLCDAVGVTLPLRTTWHEVAVVHRPPEVVRHMTYIDGALNTYFRPETGELTLVGGSVNEQDVDPDHHREGGSEQLQHEVAEKLPRRLRGMERARMQRGMAGVFATSGDGHFILDRAPGLDGLVVALGCSGTGFKIAPAVGIGLAELILSGRSETIDLRPFRATRFVEGCPIRGEHEYQDRPYERAAPAVPGGRA
jgi:sarcosine oxidase subunit beta